jgi:hypothetical protein
MAKNSKRSGRKPAAAPAAKTTGSRRVFPVGQCHQRDANGTPNCTKAIVAKRANLCPEHEKIWQAAARQRYAANRAAAAAPVKVAKPRAQRTTKVVAPVEEEEEIPQLPVVEDTLEADLAASLEMAAEA